jgi:hypothetical protein
MQNYQIRLLKPGAAPQVYDGRYLGDFHAIRRAQMLAGEDDGVEVWRGMDCIYRSETLPHRRFDIPQTPPNFATL